MKFKIESGKVRKWESGMKTLLWLTLSLSHLLTFSADAQDLPGTVVTARITTGSTNNTFSIGDTDEMKGTPKSVTSLLARDAISAARRTEGMECWVTTNATLYRLLGGTANANWAVVTNAGSGDTLWSASASDVYRSGGNVGIGTTDPAEYKLNVQGGTARTLIQSSNELPLYVQGSSTWSGILFGNPVGGSALWYHGNSDSFSFGGPGGNEHTLAVFGSMGVGENVYDQPAPTNGLIVEGGGIIGGYVGIGIGPYIVNNFEGVKFQVGSKTNALGQYPDMIIYGNAGFGASFRPDGETNDVIVYIGGRDISGEGGVDLFSAGGNLYSLASEGVMQARGGDNNRHCALWTQAYSLDDGLNRGLTTQYGLFVGTPQKGGTLTISNTYGIYVQSGNVGITNTGIYNEGTLRQIADASFDGAIIGNGGELTNLNMGTLGTVWGGITNSATGGTNLTVDQSAVGIGTMTPNSTLDLYKNTTGATVKGAILAITGIKEDNDYAGIQFGEGTSLTSGAQKGGIFFEKTAAYGFGSLHFATDATADDSNVTLSDARMTITSAGNVGIGTTSPGGDVEIRKPAATLIIDASDSDAATIRLQKGNGNSWDINSLSDNSFRLYSYNKPGYALTILPDGNVGIGTGTPAATLSVAGDIRANTTITATNGVRISSNSWTALPILGEGDIFHAASNGTPYVIWKYAGVSYTNNLTSGGGSGGATNGIQQLDGFGTNTQFYSTAYNAGTQVYDTETGFFYSADDHSLRVDMEEGELFHGGSVRVHWGNRALNGDWSADSDFTVAGTFAASGSATVADTVYADAGYFTNDCSALTFTDRSKAPSSLKDAWEIVSSMKTKNGHVDHAALSPKAYGTRIRTVTNTAPRFVKGIRQAQAKLGTVTEPDQTKRDLGMVVSAQAMVIQDLLKRLEKLEKK